MYIYLIRHGKTQGNLEKRYIGRTDESLALVGIEALKKLCYPKVNKVFCSPMLRCKETARIIYPDNSLGIVEDFRECDFGIFDNKNYFELQDNIEYQRWIDGKNPPLAGEDQEDFKNRCIKAFENLVDQALQEKIDSIALVVHGGTIMSIMEKFVLPRKSFYDWQPKNNGGWLVCLEKDEWQAKKVVNLVESI